MMAGFAFLLDKRLDMGGVFDLDALVVTALVTRQDRGAVDDADLFRRGQDAQCAPHVGMGHGIIVQIEARIGRFADGDRDLRRQRKRIVGQRQETGRFSGEGLAHGHVFAGARPIGGRACAPGVGLGVEIIQIAKAPRRKEVIANVAYGALDAAFLVSPSHGDRARIKTVVTGEGDQGGIEPDGVGAAPLKHGALQIVVQQNPWTSAPSFERLHMAGEERIHARVQEKAKKDPARKAQDRDERHQRAARPADLEMSKMTPVDLTLFARERSQPQVSLSLRARSMAGDKMAEMIAVAAIAALIDHGVQSRSGQGRKRLQRLKDEGHIGIDPRRSRVQGVRGQTGLSQDRGDSAVMNAQLTRDRPRTPLLHVVISQDLGAELRGNRHRHPQHRSIRMARRRRRNSRRTNVEQQRPQK